VDYHFVRGEFLESDFEKAFIELFEGQGYCHVSGGSIHRRYEDILLLDDLRSFLCSHYDNSLSEVEIQKIVNQLALINSSPLYSGNRDAFRLVTEGFDLEREDRSRVALHVDYIDFDNPEGNIFKVVNQYSVQDGHLRRPDLLVFINGIPVTIMEFKSAIDEDATVHDAWEQITKRYARDIPNLLKYCFLSVISDGANTRMGSIFTPYEYYYSWNKANDQDSVANGISSLKTMVEGAFAKDRILQILRDFVFYPDDSKKNEAIVCRYPQYFGAMKMLGNIKRHMRPEGDGKGGTYSGATGCGKTYTMLFLSRLIALRDNETFHNPTIIIIADREDLDSQTSELFVTAKKYLHENDVRSIESRQDLRTTLNGRPSGGVYITTIQKFCESTGMLSERSNIICISDEAHRTQTGVGSRLRRTEDGVYTTYGFGYYLRASFPNATYCGFTGTPIDETQRVFGEVVDRYTMKESSDDGITVRIDYEPRLARVILSEEQAKEIEKYYQDCIDEGATAEQVERSQNAMSKMHNLLIHPDRLEKLAGDIVSHYESLCAEKPKVVQKAMIVCADRKIAFELLKAIEKEKPEWTERHKSEHEESLTRAQLDRLEALPKINLVATQGDNDCPELYEACGSKEHRKMLDRQFKNNDSNFKIAIVVDMWITGFDIPSLAVMYIDKPLQKHTLIQTISRVNRVFDGKDKGLIVDYIGIRNDMLEALKTYNGGNMQDGSVDELDVTLSIFRNHLSLLDEAMNGFNASRFYGNQPQGRLDCLNDAVEFVQRNKDLQARFMGLAQRLKSAYAICFTSGNLTGMETAKAQFYMAIRSIIRKQTKGNAPDAEVMNKVVEEMVRKAITCTGIENIIDDNKSIDIFGEETMRQLDMVPLPITKFNALLKLLKRAITAYGKTNKVKAVEFAKRLRDVVERYNNRDRLVFVSGVVSDVVNELSDELIKIMDDLREDRKSFIGMGITYEEKAFYDILVRVRDDHEFKYDDKKCVVLAKRIKELVDTKSQYADWAMREDIKSQLNYDLTTLLYRNGYPPDWDEEVFEKVMEQTENFKRNSAPSDSSDFANVI